VKVVDTIAEVRSACDAARATGGTVGFVPTMGFFHVGHRSLMDAARRENDFVVVSLFVNPLQFGPTEDLAAYPRDLEGDVALATHAGVDLLFAPPVEEMYPAGASKTTVHVAGLTDGMCGAARPGHFDGVTTVVAKLFAIVGPCRAYFGRKDFQQVAVVRRMARDLDLPADVIGCPLVRESDGLARSSRNVYLTPAERAAAPALHASLVAAAEAVCAGERSAAVLADVVRDRVSQHPELALEYVEIRDADDLEPLDTLRGEFVVALAARAGRARLIDNVVVTLDGAAVSVDAGLRI
jgi:pantoate--beta-alanine ligase